MTMLSLPEDRHRIPHRDQLSHARGVPIGSANAAMARGASDRLGIVRAVNADVRLVQSHPEHAHRIVRPGRQIVKGARFFAVIEHALVVSENRQGCDAQNFPEPIGAAAWRPGVMDFRRRVACRR